MSKRNNLTRPELHFTKNSCRSELDFRWKSGILEIDQVATTPALSASELEFKHLCEQLEWVIDRAKRAAKIPRLTFQVDEFRKGTGRRVLGIDRRLLRYLTP